MNMKWHILKTKNYEIISGTFFYVSFLFFSSFFFFFCSIKTGLRAYFESHRWYEMT